MHSPPWVGNEIALRASLMLGTNIQPVSSPATICSDIFMGRDLLELLKKGGDVPKTSYIFTVRQSIQHRKNTAIVLWF